MTHQLFILWCSILATLSLRRGPSFKSLFKLKSSPNSNNVYNRPSNDISSSANIDYVYGSLSRPLISSSSDSLQSDKLVNTSIVPFHLVTSNDLFCNRELNMARIEAVGFDMDWTLAQYKEEFDLLAYNGAMRRLVETMAYPTDLFGYKYKQNSYRRGCVIDKRRGNILKLDRHNYVRVAEHGQTSLPRQERKSVYKKTFEHVSEFHSGAFEFIDTPFSVVDACIFAQLVDLKDRLGSSNELLAGKSYQQLWTDLRLCVDACHKNGVIKQTVANNPDKYIYVDPNRTFTKPCNNL